MAKRSDFDLTPCHFLSGLWTSSWSRVELVFESRCSTLHQKPADSSHSCHKECNVSLTFHIMVTGLSSCVLLVNVYNLVAIIKKIHFEVIDGNAVNSLSSQQGVSKD